MLRTSFSAMLAAAFRADARRYRRGEKRLQDMHAEAVQASPSYLRRVQSGAALLLGIALFGVICLGWTLIALPLLLLPQRWGRRVGRRGIQVGFGFFFRALRRLGVGRYDVQALAALRAGPPVVLAPNHPALLDALLIIAQEPRVACVLKSSLLSNVFLGAGARLARYIRHDPPRAMIRAAVEELERGGIVLLFPEGTRTACAPVSALQAGVGIIAKQARVPVQTVIIELDAPYGSRGSGLLRFSAVPFAYRMRLGKCFDPPEDVRSFMTELDRYFRQTLASAPQQQWLERCESLPRARSNPS
jgi:1-acyl-sn-glycerol-3-phosphate acyltransferase